MSENRRRQLKRIEAYLTWSPLPNNPSQWSYEPSISLLTERQSENLAGLFERITESFQFGHSMDAILLRLSERDVILLEVFVNKTLKGKAIAKARQMKSPSTHAA